MSWLLQKKSNNRPSCREALSHSWFRHNRLFFKETANRTSGPKSKIFTNFHSSTTRLGPKKLVGDDGDIGPEQLREESDRPMLRSTPRVSTSLSTKNVFVKHKVNGISLTKNGEGKKQSRPPRPK